MTSAHRSRPARAAAVLAVVALSGSLSGCWGGFNAQTSQQANQSVGNGINANVGSVQIRGAILVRSLQNPLDATLVATFSTNDGEPDRLIRVETDPASKGGITGGALEIPPKGSLRTGYLSPNFVNVFGLEAFPSTFVRTTLTFEKAGPVTMDLLTVPNAGQYANVIANFKDQLLLQKFIRKQSGEKTPAELRRDLRRQRIKERLQQKALEKAQAQQQDTASPSPIASPSQPAE